MQSGNDARRRRRFKRFSVKGGAIALLQRPGFMGLGKPKMIELGPVVNISMGGMAVQFIESKSRSLDGQHLAIRAANEEIRLQSLNFRIVSDRVIAVLPDGRQIHNCCIEFLELNAYQRYQMERFIQIQSGAAPVERRRRGDRRRFADPKFQAPERNGVFERRSGVERRSNWPPD